ncbi:ribonuclease Z [compost metagenome]
MVSDDDLLRVTALRNHHPPIDQSYALKFEIKGGKTIVFSGDTSYFPPLAEFAANADYLIHEVMYLPAMERTARRSANASSLLAHLKAAHTTTTEVGQIAAAANVKNLVLTHFVPGGDPSVTADDWLEGVRQYYRGNVIVGRDLMEIDLG